MSLCLLLSQICLDPSGSRLIWVWMILDPEQDFMFSAWYFGQSYGFDSYLALLLSFIYQDLPGSRLTWTRIILDPEQKFTFLSVFDFGMINWVSICVSSFRSRLTCVWHFQDPD